MLSALDTATANRFFRRAVAGAAGAAGRVVLHRSRVEVLFRSAEPRRVPYSEAAPPVSEADRRNRVPTVGSPFGWLVPEHAPGIRPTILHPRHSHDSPQRHDEPALMLLGRFEAHVAGYWGC